MRRPLSDLSRATAQEFECRWFKELVAQREQLDFCQHAVLPNKTTDNGLEQCIWEVL